MFQTVAWSSGLLKALLIALGVNCSFDIYDACTCILTNLKDNRCGVFVISIHCLVLVILISFIVFLP